MNRILRLLIDNRQLTSEQRGFKVEAKEDVLVLYIYDVIVSSDADAAWWGGVSAESVVKQIRASKASKIELRVNSPGGDVFGGRAIEAALRDTKAEVTAYIDGIAASAASFLVMGANEVVMHEGAMMMIHKAWSMAVGNADDMVKMAEVLGKVDETLITTYASKTGLERDEVEALLAAETYLTAQEAVEKKFADRVVEGAKAELTWNISALKETPVKEEPTAKEEEKKPDHTQAREHAARRVRAIEIGLTGALA